MNDVTVDGWADADAVVALAGELAGRVFDCYGEEAWKFALLSRHRRHLLLAVLDGSPVPASALTSLQFGELSNSQLSAALNGLLPCGLWPIAKRLSREPLPPGLYRRLCKALDDERLARQLSHLPVLNAEIVRTALSLPADLRYAGFIQLVPSEDQAATIAAVIDLVQNNGRTRADVVGSLLHAADYAAVERLLRKAMIVSSLPDCGFAGTDQLVRITDPSELKALGATFRNCLRGMAEMYVNQQRTAFFVWRGGPNVLDRAVASVSRDQFGWHIGEIRGPGNADVSDAAEKLIRQALTAGGIADRLSADALLMNL
jgi:hypothetical protein